MKYKVTQHTPGVGRLILFFAGWGMDDRPFAGLCREGYDVAVLWDYRSMHIDWAFTAAYSEICIVAWSMGVFAASVSTHAIDHKVTRRVAINGTLAPVSDDEGIPQVIFDGTRERLDERNLAKFYRRMFADRAAHEVFLLCRPSRDVGGLRDELTAVADAMVLNPGYAGSWDRAYVGSADAIFPPAAQRRSWERHGVPVVMADSGHWLDFQEVLTRELVDKSTMARRFAARRDTYEQHGSVQAEVVEELCSAVLALCRRDLATTPGPVLEVGCGSGALSRRLAEMAPDAAITLWDIAGDCPEEMADRPGCRFVRADAELAVTALADQSVRYIFSASTIQWFNSPSRFLAQCARVLRPGGMLALSTFTRGNLEEISAITGRTLQLPAPQGWIDMAATWFDVAVARAWVRDLDFETPIDALRHLQLTGVNSLGGSAREVVRRFPMRLDARYHLTYRPMILILYKK